MKFRPLHDRVVVKRLEEHKTKGGIIIRTPQPDREGHINPAEVVRTALQDAASVDGLLVTTESGVAEAPKKKEEHVHMPGGGMGGMDMM
jgi:chaperonin GroEL